MLRIFFSSDYLRDIEKLISDYLSGLHVEFNNEEIVLPDGSSIFVESKGVRTKFEGKPAIQSSVRDVTARIIAERQLIESEERYRNAIENSTDIIYNTDLDGNLTFANAVFESVSGYTEIEVLGKDVNILVAPSHQKLIKKTYYDFFKSSENNFITSVLAKTKSEKEIWLELNISKIKEDKKILGFTAIARDITDRVIAERKLRDLTKHLQTIEEEERAYIAKEIHDELGQRLTGIKMNLSWIGEKTPMGNHSVIERINTLNTLIDDTIKSVRKISSELHPVILDDLGLKAAMEWQISEFIRRADIECTLIMNEDEFDFDMNQSKALFRIVQESLTNILRHANADKVSIILEKKELGTSLSIIDNGIGITNENDPLQKSFGILSMEERASTLGGVLSINGKLNQGTHINLFIPNQLKTV